MLGVDRLDMIKGIPQKLLAFEKFLEENPYWRGKVVLLQIAVPTRPDVPDYQKLTSQVHEIVGRINGRFGTLTAGPIHHLDRSLDFHALCALYAVTDVSIVTSLRDGMNLVSYESVACQDAKKGVLILSEFAGVAQSLGAGAILVNPWNIIEVAASIEQALNMPAEEREKRHCHNFHHVIMHTAQEWAETFVSELNDTVVEAQLRSSKVPPELPQNDAMERYLLSSNRLLILGFNATLTEPVDTPRSRGDQIKEMELKLHLELGEPLTALCNDPKTTVVVLSGSDRRVLDKNFGEYNMWLAAENGMFLQYTEGDWMTTMPEHLNLEWVDSVKHVFEYFTERTPRSHFDFRDTSLVWNYKHADVEFGRHQARDMLQHLWTGSISNASVNVVQGGRSVEVRAVGITKGAAIDRILGEIVYSKSMTTSINYVLCIGHFLGKDEDVYSFFELELSFNALSMTRSKPFDGPKLSPAERRPQLKLPTSRSGAKSSSTTKTQRLFLPPDQRTGNNYSSGSLQRPSVPEKMSWSVLDLQGDNYFSCAVGRTRTSARYLLGSSDDVVSFLNRLANASPSCTKVFGPTHI
ncbi:Alpha,alpha-trehalose-phosphate synthase 1 [Hibiscus syriacus]|uniref:Alpha,alpha-trehalose-phosphate synthase 1 n=1 Tax=Hibiscus syriacus TaxID=106335 RepID=A0A6A2XJ56_HIBSY|nr:Alpha,alpha-trehalose-phosphate synthase 1 [Hibiscus syriacus]